MIRTRAELDHLGLCSPNPNGLAAFYERALGMVSRLEGDDLILRNFEGNTYRYTDPDGTVGADRTLDGGQV